MKKCGKWKYIFLNFLPSPFTPQNVKYSDAAQNITPQSVEYSDAVQKITLQNAECRA